MNKISDWIETTIGEYCPFIYGKTLPKTKRVIGKFPVYGSNGIIDFHNDFYVKPFGIIVGRKGSVGAIHISEKPFWAIDTTFYIIKDSLDELKFIYFLLKTLRLNEMNSDSAVPGLNRENAHSIKIRIPKYLKHREFLGKYLSSFDQKIQLNTEINQTLEQIAQVVFKSWFIDFDPVYAKANALADGQTAEQAERSAMEVLSGKNSEELDRLQASNPTAYQQLATLAATFPSEFVEIDGFGNVPKGGEKVPLSSFGDIICGKTPSKSKIEYYGNDIPFIKIPDMHNNLFTIKTVDSLSKLGGDSQHKKYIKKGSVCVSCIATVGLVSIASQTSQTNQQINSIVPYKEYYSEYIYLYLSQREMKHNLHSLASGGSTTLNLNTSTFSKIEIIKPDSKLLTVFNERVKSIFNKILNNSNENITLAKTRDELLPKLLSNAI